MISFLLDGDASPPSTPRGPKTASKFQNENSNIKFSNVWIHLKMEVSQLLTINQTTKKSQQNPIEIHRENLGRNQAEIQDFR